MRNFLLIARHEYIKYITRRGFIISLLMFPLWVGLGGVLPGIVSRVEPSPAFIVVDHDGGFKPAIETALARIDAARTVRALANFATKNKADFEKLSVLAPDIAAMIKEPERETSQQTFFAKGGLDPVFRIITQALPAGWGEFTAPKPLYTIVETPDELSKDPDIARAAEHYFNRDRGVGKGLKLAAIVVIPKDYGAPSSGPAGYWSDEARGSPLEGLLQNLLSQTLRERAVLRAAPELAANNNVFATNADIKEFDPVRETKGGAEQMIEKLLPFGFAFVLFMATFISSNALLMGVVEEKSTRMIEILLSSASAREIMAGKLLGAIGASLTTIVLWTLGLFAAISALSPELSQAILSEAGTLFAAGNLPLLLFYFVAGLLIYGTLFLGIGSMAASVVDAQALLGPATLILIFPNVMVSVILADPNGLFARIISWIPIYTPFFMLMRLPSHPAAIEIWATSALTLVTAVFVVLQMSKVFENNVLTTERPPGFGKFIRSLFRNLSARKRS